MTPKRYLEIKKEELYVQLEAEGVSSDKIDSIYDEIGDIIFKLSKVRHSRLLTEKLLKSFYWLQNEYIEERLTITIPLGESDKTEAIEDVIRKSVPRDKTNNRTYVQELLIKSVANDKSYGHAYNIVAQMINKMEGQVFYPVRNISEPEILELIELEYNKQEEAMDIIKTESVGFTYTTTIEKELLNNLYTHCTEIITCAQSEFNRAIKTADFSHVEVKTTYKVQHLLFKLSSLMGDDWYTKAVKSMGWTKTVCSGHKKRLEDDVWRKQLDKIVPTKTL